MPPFLPNFQVCNPLLVPIPIMVIGIVILHSSSEVCVHIHLFSHFSIQNCLFAILRVNLGTIFDKIKNVVKWPAVAPHGLKLCQFEAYSLYKPPGSHNFPKSADFVRKSDQNVRFSGSGPRGSEIKKNKNYSESKLTYNII